LAVYSIGCGIKGPTTEEKARDDSLRTVYDQRDEAERQFNQRKDTLTIILNGNPQKQYRFGGADVASITGYTIDSTIHNRLKSLRIEGDNESLRICSALKAGSVLTFILPKKGYGERVDSSSAIYDFSQAPGNDLNYIVSVDGMPFPK
jgi:hypothetical protein